jgi:hypothetical protein
MSTDEPENLIESRPFAHRTILIPAGEEEVIQSKEFINKTGEAWKVTTIAPHMHLLGVRVTVEHIKEDGTESCLLDIPNWDFNWQRFYALPTDEYVTVAPGERVRLTCQYDNSVSNQSIVDGVGQEPNDVVWGDGTLDEMCLTFLTLIKPFDAPLAQCEAYNLCALEYQDESNLTRMLSCLSADVSCALCVIGDVFADDQCLDLACAAEISTADDCLLECAAGVLAGGGDINDCMKELCPEEREALDVCATPAMDGGQCDVEMLGCGIF